MTDNYYETLGVSQDATDREIRKAYRDLARKIHPDKNPDDPDATTKFQKIQEAHETLSDADKRQAYDRELAQQQTESNPDVAEENKEQEKAEQETVKAQQPKPETKPKPTAKKKSKVAPKTQKSQEESQLTKGIKAAAGELGNPWAKAMMEIIALLSEMQSTKGLVIDGLEKAAKAVKKKLGEREQQEKQESGQKQKQEQEEQEKQEEQERQQEERQEEIEERHEAIQDEEIEESELSTLQDMDSEALAIEPPAQDASDTMDMGKQLMDEEIGGELQSSDVDAIDEQTQTLSSLNEASVSEDDDMGLSQLFDEAEGDQEENVEMSTLSDTASPDVDVSDNSLTELSQLTDSGVTEEIGEGLEEGAKSVVSSI